MKRIKYILALLCACLTFTVTSASAPSAETVSISGGDHTLAEIFDDVYRQTGAIVIFDADRILPAQTVTLAAHTGSVAKLLDTVLPKTQYAWQAVGDYIVVRTLPASPAETPQPSREAFERDVLTYTQRYIDPLDAPQAIRYDTIRTEIPHSGVFDYPGRQITPGFTKTAARTPLARTTPPLLAIKTNLVWWAARGTLNLGGELGLGKRTSVELSAGLNRWNLKGNAQNNKKLAHWIVKPEFRYWLCERFNGHFFGVHALYGQYNVGGYDIPLLFEKEFRYEGEAYGAGINYGYHLILGKRWGLEFTAGLGVVRIEYSKYDCPKCGSKIGKFGKTYFGPTELGVKVVFLIK